MSEASLERRVVLVRHGDDPLDDRVCTYLSRAGFDLDVRRPYAGDPLPVGLEPDVVGTVVYGGGFVVTDTHEHPFLLEEHRWIEACLAADVPLLGICQGAQSMAHVLGARVGPPANGMTEFGCYPIHATPEGRELFGVETLHVTQAHFHELDTPTGATNLAWSDAFPNQAFRVGTRAYGLQFHPEVTIEGFRRWQDAPWARYGEPGAQTRDEQTRLLEEHDPAQARWFEAFLGSLFGSPSR